MKKAAWFTLLLTIPVLLTACGSNPTTPALSPTTAAGTTTVTVYFGNSEMNPEADCSRVFPLERTIPATDEPVRAALELLFQGPSEEEQTQGYHSWFSPATADILIGLSIQNNTAYVNLKDVRPIIPSANSSCGSAAFFAEVETTVKGVAPGVERVLMAIEDDPEAFYEWMQYGCDENNDFCDPAPFTRN